MRCLPVWFVSLSLLNFFLRLCLAAPAPVSSGLSCCLNACRQKKTRHTDEDWKRKKRSTGVGSKKAGSELWLVCGGREYILPDADKQILLFLDQLRRSGAIQQWVVLNELLRGCCSSSSLSSSVWLQKSSLPPHIKGKKRSLFFSFS